jgi:hypothetical protein
MEDITEYMREKGVLPINATEIYIKSKTANLNEDGVADLHCRSDKYLAGEIWREFQENGNTETI